MPIDAFFKQHPGLLVIVIICAIWSLIWKGVSLWNAGKRGDKAWFIILLVANTLGILDIIYLIFVAKVFGNKEKTENN